MKSKKQYIRYSSNHEDADILIKYAKEEYTGNALSIGSAGDNSFSLLTKNFKNIYVVDSNIAQIYLIKLKACAIKYLTYDEYLTFIGIKDDKAVKRIVLYNKISNYLDKETKVYFDKNIKIIKNKIIFSGKFDKYLRIFAKKVLPLIHSKKTIEKFFSFKSIDEQAKYYDDKFNNKRFKIIFKLFFGNKTMKAGRDEDCFNYVFENISEMLQKRIEIGFKNNLNETNPYIYFAGRGYYNKLPHYLDIENFNLIKNNIDKLIYINDDLNNFLNKNIKFDFYNLSDIFEYMSEEDTMKHELKILNSVNNNARIVFWNMINKRKFINEKFDNIKTEEDFIHDKAFYYSNLFIYEVKNDN